MTLARGLRRVLIRLVVHDYNVVDENTPQSIQYTSCIGAT